MDDKTNNLQINSALHVCVTWHDCATSDQSQPQCAIPAQLQPQSQCATSEQLQPQCAISDQSQPQPQYAISDQS